MSESVEVQRYLDALSHSRHTEIVLLRDRILDSDTGFSESVKWNAPNFVYAGADRATFRLHPREQFQVILHRGAATASAAPVAFATDSSLVSWISPDRGVIDVPAAPGFEQRLDDLVDLIAAWARA